MFDGYAKPSATPRMTCNKFVSVPRRLQVFVIHFGKNYAQVKY